LENLSILGSLKHPNILELLTSYTHRGLHNLIFPLAEGGNLSQLLYGSNVNSAFLSQETIFVALTGLGSAIECLHTFVDEKMDLYLTGFHHDLRPKNILVQGSTFILADFGLTRFKDISEHSNTPFREGTGDYVAPECEDVNHSYEKSRVHRSSDIWSFGCILAEIAVYMSHGSAGVKDFRERRKFRVPHHHGRGHRTFALFHCGPNKRNDAVHATLDSLKSLGWSSLTALVNLIKQILVLDESQRPKASEMASELRLITLKLLIEELEQLFNGIQSQNNSLDGTIEHERLNAWAYGAGIRHKSKSTACTISMESFRTILELLSQMHNQLKVLSPTCFNSKRSAFVPISRLNDSLENLLSDDQQEISKTYFKAAFIKHNSPDSEILNEMPTSSSIKIRVVLSQMEKLILDHSSRNSHHQQLNPKSVRIGKAFGDHNIAIWTQNDVSRQVLVEWHRHNRESVDETVTAELFMRLEALTQHLALKKPPEFRALDCRGFFHDPSRIAFGVVFELSNTLEETRNLTDLLSKNPRLSQQPLLENKYKLAFTLAQSVLEFHLVGWLHKRLKPSNIVFFPGSGQNIDSQIQHVYIIGFNHSRPNEPNAFTGGFRDADGRTYQHPDYLRRADRFRPEFDYYSLGLILLEIGLWSPLKGLVKPYLDGPADKLRDVVLSIVPTLGSTMGRVYRDTVASCINGQFSSSGNSTLDDGPSMGKHFGFERGVVIPLKRLSNG
jgi:serine/threonine protein kinase